MCNTIYIKFKFKKKKKKTLPKAGMVEDFLWIYCIVEKKLIESLTSF